MQGNELVSIITPMYNAEKYVEKTIQSVLSQTYKNWEIIIVNDGSTDSSLDIAERYVKNDARIKIVNQPRNMGISAARNKGIEQAKGDYIAFIDSDDMWEERKLEIQISYAKKNNAGFIFTGASYIDENGESYRGTFNVPEKVSYKELLKQNVISCSSVMIRKSYFSDIKMENDSIHEDFCVWLKILQTEDFAYGINEPLLVYRISRKSKSGNKLKSLKMAYKTYRYIGINSIRAGCLLFFYIIRNLKKYKKIFK